MALDVLRMKVDWRKRERRACESHGEERSAKNELATYTMLFCCGRLSVGPSGRIFAVAMGLTLSHAGGGGTPGDLLQELILLPFD